MGLINFRSHMIQFLEDLGPFCVVNHVIAKYIRESRFLERFPLFLVL